MIDWKLQASVYFNIAYKANDYHVNFYLRVGRVFRHFFDEYNPAPARLAAQVTAFLAAIDREDSFYNQIRKSDFTLVLSEWDKKRDNNTSSLRSMANVYANNPRDAEKQAWAQRVLYLLKHFNVSISDNFEMQGSRTLQFCQCIDTTPEYRAAIDGIGAGDFYDAMKDANEHCINIVDLRNEERAQASQDTMVALRKVTDAEYRDLILITNAFALAQDNIHAYDTLINNLNELVTYYEKTVFAGSGDSTSGGIQGGGDGGGGTTTDPTTPGEGDDNGGTPPDDGGDDNGGDTPPAGGDDNGGDTPPSGGDDNGGGGNTPPPFDQN